MSDYRLRQGHHAPRNLWEHPTDQPPDSKSGTDVGRVDSAALAEEIVAAVNAARATGHHHDDPITEAIHSALVELHPDADPHRATGDPAGLHSDAAHIANRVRAALAADNQGLRDRVAQAIADVHANTPAPPPGYDAVFVVDAYADAVMETIGTEATRIALDLTHGYEEQYRRDQQDLMNATDREDDLRSGVWVMPGLKGGRACVGGTRVPVADVADLMADGVGADQISEYYPSVTTDGAAAAHYFADRYVDRHARDRSETDPRTEVEAHWGGDPERIVSAWENDRAELEQEVTRLRAINAELKNDAQYARDNQHFRMAAIIAAVICDTEHGNGEVDGTMPHFDLAGRILTEAGIDGHLQDREHQMSDLVEQIGDLKHERDAALARARELAEEA